MSAASQRTAASAGNATRRQEHVPDVGAHRKVVNMMDTYYTTIGTVAQHSFAKHASEQVTVLGRVA